MRMHSFHCFAHSFFRTQKSGSALIAVLWCLVILSVVVLSTLHSTLLDLRIAKNYGDLEQARYLAFAGVEKAKALIYQELNGLGSSEYLNTDTFEDNPYELERVQLDRGYFTVSREDRSTQRVKYGVSDEESRLNINQASSDELQKLPGITREIAAAIIDWRDSDDKLTEGGAEFDAYSELSPPYVPRNGPIESLLELLMIRGITPEFLLGEDTNGNNSLDPEEDDGALTAPFDNADGILDMGLSEFITVNSSVENVNRGNQSRINIQTSDETDLANVESISQQLANAIVSYRNEHPFKSLADLLDVVLIQKQNDGQENSSSTAAPPQPGNAPVKSPEPNRGDGPKLINESLLKEIIDDLTTSNQNTLIGLININSASTDVLSCLPGIEIELAESIVNYRHLLGSFSNIAEVLDAPDMTVEIFKQICNKITVRPGVFRIFSKGIVPSTGAQKKLQVILKLDDFGFTTLYYREDS